MKPTKEQLADPAWWNINTESTDSYVLWNKERLSFISLENYINDIEGFTLLAKRPSYKDVNIDTVAWICDDDDITESESVAKNWKHHNYSVMPLSHNELNKYRDAISIQSVYECSGCYLQQNELNSLKGLFEKVISRKGLPLVFCDASDSFSTTRKNNGI